MHNKENLIDVFFFSKVRLNSPGKNILKHSFHPLYTVNTEYKLSKCKLNECDYLININERRKKMVKKKWE